MYISTRKRNKLYLAIHDSISDLRVKLNLSPKEDVVLAQLEHTIWKTQKEILKLEN